MSDVFGQIEPLDSNLQTSARKALRSAISQIFGTQAGFGDIERLGGWIAACQGSNALPRPIEQLKLVIVAGDAAVPDEASKLPADSSTTAAASFEDGSSPIFTAAASQNISVDFVDASPRQPSDEGVADLDSYLRQGMDLADSAADSGIELLFVGDYGRGLTTTAATVIGTICSIEPVKVVGRGSGISDTGWKEKVALIRDNMFAVRDDRADVRRVLQRVGSANLAVLTGLLAQAAVRRTPVIFDGLGATAAALCAQVLAPGSKGWWQAATAGTEPAIHPALSALQMSPLSDHEIGLGQGIGTLTIVPLIRLATGFNAAEPTL